ncbi:sensor histidine kinase [Pedobacter frigoris]|uniref:sensor histidine kinase n=1 Tax=Pedobacter frigoris TaxID=2571272 RepID=UPI00292F91F8|nr:histidine kinase [Pedobacter frigoris]
MNRESIVLRALNNVLSQDTIATFLVVIVFLLLTDIVLKKIIKPIRNKWFASFSAAWLSTIILLASYGIIKLFGMLVMKFRFGSDGQRIGFWFSFPLMIRCLIISLIISSVYLIYFWAKEKWINDIKSPAKRPIYEALIMFLIACVAILIIQFSANMRGGGYGIESAFLSLAIASSAIFGTCSATFIYGYSSYLNTFKIQQKELQIVRLQQQVAQSQLDALSSKINPHFLYNSLNSIAGLAMEDGLKTRNMAIALSKLFRYNINREENNYATVGEEMEMVSLYLEIEKIRFEERLQYSSNIEPGIENELIPVHLLQPLVENAVKYGAGPNGIVINISIKKSGKDTVLSVFDEGKAFDTGFNPGYGLKSLYDKLDILAAGKYEIAFLNEPKEVRITISDLKAKA